MCIRDRPQHFNYLEKTLGDAEYFVGDELTLADLALCCQLINMEHGTELLDSGRWPALAAHYPRIRAREPVQTVLPGQKRTPVSYTHLDVYKRQL